MNLSPDTSAITVEAIFPNFHSEAWVSYSLKSVIEGMVGDGINLGATVLAKGSNVTASYVHPCFNGYVYMVINRWIKNPVYWTFKSARRRLSRGDVAYFWLESPAYMCEDLRANGIMVVREMINCTYQMRRQELQKAYSALGMSDRSGITDEMIEKERRDILAVDAVFCPNPFVKKSVMEYGFPAEQCISTSYGWSAQRLGGVGRIAVAGGVFTAAFVGTADVRKGAPVLLEAWVRSGIKGRLLLAGAVSAEVRERYDKILNRPDIVQLGHVDDVGSVYRAADVFIFPTWEEGGPLVTLEAMAIGAVPIVTPMGTSGAFSETDNVGIIVPPGNVDKLCEALCTLANDSTRLHKMGREAIKRAAEYSWDVVGNRRRIELIQRRNNWLRGLNGN